MPINNNILNQKGTPAFYSDIFANRPAFGYAGRVFISTDTGAIYEDTGSAWTLIADAGAGTTGTLQQVTTNGNTTTLGIIVQGININDGAGTGTLNTGIGAAVLNANTTGGSNTAIGYNSLQANTTASFNTAIGTTALGLNTTGASNTAIGYASLFSNTIGANNTAIGYISLNQNTTADNNTAIGHASLVANTTGSSNTAIGKNALNNNTTASNNTAIGNSSLASNTTASFNTAIGATSLQLNTTGGSNTAVGYQSLNANTTGANNTALGLSALSGNTTASFNTAIGSSSLLNNTTGAQNTAIGYLSLSANTTGTQNTAIGNNALQNNTTGSFNTAIGQLSLNTNTTGATNTALGSQSLQLNTTGTLNTAIGNAAGSLITTGSNNTIIGNYAGTATLASNIVLSDGAGNVRLFSDANGLIGINQAVGSTIGGQLDIHSTQTYALVLNGLSTSNAYTAFSNASVGKWRIGNTYNAGANTFDIFNLGTSSSALNINITTNNIGIGTTTQTSSANYTSLVINGTTGSEIYLRGANVDYGYMYANSNGVVLATQTSIPLTFQTDATNRMRIVGSNGNVLIGSITDDTINKLQVTGSVKIGTTSGGDALIITANAGTNAAAFSFINGGGTKYIGAENSTGGSLVTGSTGYDFIIRGNTGIGFSGNNGASINLRITSGGVITISNLAGTGSRAVLADASGNLSAPVSDISVKENINTIGYGLNEILKMNPVWFNYNEEYKNYGEGRQNGNIAQDIEAIIPEAVFTTPSTGKMGINYDQLHAVYIKAIQELNEKLERNNIN